MFQMLPRKKSKLTLRVLLILPLTVLSNAVFASAEINVFCESAAWVELGFYNRADYGSTGRGDGYNPQHVCNATSQGRVSLEKEGITLSASSYEKLTYSEKDNQIIIRSNGYVDVNTNATVDIMKNSSFGVLSATSNMFSNIYIRSDKQVKYNLSGSISVNGSSSNQAYNSPSALILSANNQSSLIANVDTPFFNLSGNAASSFYVKNSYPPSIDPMGSIILEVSSPMKDVLAMDYYSWMSQPELINVPYSAQWDYTLILDSTNLALDGSSPPPVATPLPSSALLFGSAMLGGFVSLRRRFIGVRKITA